MLRGFFKENASEAKRLKAHYAVFLGIYTFYGYQVCPFLDDLSIAGIMLPAMLAVVIHLVARSYFLEKLEAKGIEGQVIRIFQYDWLTFSALGIGISAYNFLYHEFPLSSGGKVLVGFIVFGLYIALDTALRRDLAIARRLRSKGEDYPISSQFLSYPTKFMLFSALNVSIMGLIGVLVAVKDLVWVRNTDLSAFEIQAFVFLDTAVVVAILSGYILLVVRQYGKKIRFALREENKTLRAVQNGDLTSRVPVISNDEFGHLAHLTNSMISQLGDSIEEVARNKSATIQAFVALAAKRDNETGLHLKRTQLYVELLARHLMQTPKFLEILNKEHVETIVDAAPLHDIGKVGIPDAVLCKPGRLNPTEFEIMQTHTTIGAEALAEANEKLGGSSFIYTAIEIAEFHHEKWDGTGYPHRIRGNDIPLAARIMAVADVYDAIRSQRVYKPARSHKDALSVVLDGSGSHFDPEIVEAFLAVEQDFEEISEWYKDDVETVKDMAEMIA